MAAKYHGEMYILGLSLALWSAVASCFEIFCRFFRPSREVTVKTLMINNFQKVRFSHLLAMYHYQEIDAALSESAQIFSPQCPLAEIFELVYRCPLLVTTVYWKLGPETD